MNKCKNLRVLFFMATGSPVGGVATWLDRACSELSSRGVEPIVGLVQGLHLHNPDVYRKFHPNLPARVVDGRGFNREGRIRACQREIRRVAPNVVLPLGVLDAADAALRFSARSKSIYTVARAQGNLPPMLADLEDRRTGFDHVVCVGEMTRRFLVRHAGFSGDRVTHIANGATLATHPRVPSKDQTPLRLGFIGRLTNGDKRVLDIPPFCHALDALSIPFHLSIIGSGPSEAELRDKLRIYGDRVRFTGAIPSADVYSGVLPSLDVLLLFSSSETFGIVLAEAMMNGVVPVTSRYIGSQAQQLVVEDKHGLAFDVGDFAAAAGCVQRLHQDRQLLRQLSEAGQEHAQRDLSWKKCFDQWTDVLSQVIAKPPVAVCPRVAAARKASHSRLDRIRIPESLRDGLRRLRRVAFGPGISAGGEEWPLFDRHHSPDRLTTIERQCRELEVQARHAVQPETVRHNL